MGDDGYNDIIPGASAQIEPVYEAMRLAIDADLSETDLQAIHKCVIDVFTIGVHMGAAEVVGGIRADAIAHGEEPPDIHLDIRLGGRS